MSKKKLIKYIRAFEYDYKEMHFKVQKLPVKHSLYDSYLLSYDGEVICKFNYVKKDRVLLFSPDDHFITQSNVSSLYEATQFVYKYIYDVLKKEGI